MIGRDVEIAALQRWLADPWARLAIVEGEAGIGKTTVWRSACSLAADARLRGRDVLAVRGRAPSGLRGADRPPRAAALRRGRRDGAPAPPGDRGGAADGRRPGRGARRAGGRLRGARPAAARRPSPAAGARRSTMPSGSTAPRWPRSRSRSAGWRPEDRVALMVARRSGVDDDASRALVAAVDPDARTTVAVGPLSLGAIHRLFRERLELSLARPRMVQVHEVCGGNPLFALEIGRGLVDEPARRTGRLPIPPSLGDALGTRLERADGPRAARGAAGRGGRRAHGRAARRRGRGARRDLRGWSRRRSSWPATARCDSSTRCWPRPPTPAARSASAAPPTPRSRVSWARRRSAHAISRSRRRGRTQRRRPPSTMRPTWRRGAAPRRRAATCASGRRR